MVISRLGEGVASKRICFARASVSASSWAESGVRRLTPRFVGRAADEEEEAEEEDEDNESEGDQNGIDDEEEERKERR